MDIPIVYENKNLLVVDKPAGLLVHPAKNEKNTLINYFPKAKLVHRLDKDTSGLLLLAKNEHAYNWLKDQFKNRKVTKKYLALVQGVPKQKTGIITKSISRSKKRGRIQTTAPIGKRRTAITRYKLLKTYGECSLLEASPKTGRTHQIRVHLASIGHPVVGDKKYKFKRQSCPPELDRQFLHASYLKFKTPKGKTIELESKLPKKLAKILKIV